MRLFARCLFYIAFRQLPELRAVLPMQGKNRRNCCRHLYWYDKAPSAMGFEPMTPGYKPADNQSSCIRCCRCLYGSGFLPRRRTAHCRTHIRVTKSYQIQGTIFRWDLNPRHEDFQSPAIPLSYCMDCCWCLCDHILPFVCEIIVEKKLRTQNFTPESAFFWFSSLSQSFLTESSGKTTFKTGPSGMPHHRQESFLP